MSDSERLYQLADHLAAADCSEPDEVAAAIDVVIAELRELAAEIQIGEAEKDRARPLDELVAPLITMVGEGQSAEGQRQRSGIAKIEPGDPRYCPEAMAARHHDPHRYGYEYDSPTGGRTTGFYECNGLPMWDEPYPPSETTTNATSKEDLR